MVENKYTYSQLKETRLLFSKNKQGKELFKIALRSAKRTPDELIALREEFSSGERGELSFMYVAIKSPCEQGCCSKLGELTLCFDAGGGEDLKIVCQDHYETAEKEYYESIEKQGIHGVASKNGWGRP
jgi:hypothetical protein